MRDNRADQTKYHPFDDDVDEKRNQSLVEAGSKNNNWLNDLLISISTTAESLVISDGVDLIALIKLRINSEHETIDKYVIKPLEINCQNGEFVTSVLCLPIMSSQRTGIGLVDWNAIVVGYSSGYTKFYDEQSSCLLSLRFYEDEVINLRLQTLKQNTNSRSESHFPTLSEEFTIVHKRCAIIIDGFGLYENLVMAKRETAKGIPDPAYDAMTLPCVMTCKRWTLEGTGIINDCDNFGIRKRSIFDTLVSSSISQEHDTAKICGQMMITTGQGPFVACYRESKSSTVHSYSDWIGSIFSIWKQKPPASKTQMIDSSTQTSLEFKDRDRLGTSIVSSPDKRLAAITDDFGRVILLDVTNWIAVRIWKGYRYAQCGWVEISRDVNEAKCPRALFLVIYAPKRGLMEIWSMQRGPRVAAFNVGKDCLLLFNNHRMLNMRAELLVKGVNNPLVEQSYSNNCFLFNPNDNSIYTIEVPYSCSLSKDGDLKSRDNLLLNEFTHAIKQDEDLDHLSEILFKITLVESRTKAIHRLLTMSSLPPDSLIQLMVSFKDHILKCYTDKVVNNDETVDSSKVTTDPPYDIMTADDLSMLELVERVVKLCDIFKRLSDRKDETTVYTKASNKILSRYNEHPEEIDELAEKLGWTASEVARCISLLALEQSFPREFDDSPWPMMGEPLSWDEFVNCFDLTVNDYVSGNKRSNQQSDKQSLGFKPTVQLRLLKMDAEFLNSERMIKTSSLIYSELFSAYATNKKNIDCYNYIDPASRLTMLYQFWLNSKLCNYWMTWQNLQLLTGHISDDLKVVSAKMPIGESYLIDAWKLVYNLILESDNLFASIIATATVKNDTLRLIHKSESVTSKSPSEVLDSFEINAAAYDCSNETSWENLYIDAERLALLNLQLEDVLFLSLLLHYSFKEQRLVNRHIYKLRKISVASILRGGPSLVSELVAQWAVQTNLDLSIFVETYRDIDSESGASKPKEKSNVFVQQDSRSMSAEADNHSIYSISTIVSSTTIENANEAREDGIEQALELMHHVRTSFPNSLLPDILYMNCFWEYCLLWSNNPTVNHIPALNRSIDCLILISSTTLRHKLAFLAWKTFFQRTLERLSLLFETHSTLISTKTARVRDGIIKKELNMSEDCLDGFVKFCSELTELMLQTHMVAKMESMPVFKQDDWWLSPKTNTDQKQYKLSSSKFTPGQDSVSHTLISGASSVNLVDSELLVVLNRLCTILYMVLSLRITKAYPISLIGSEARQMLRLDLQGESKSRYEPIDELRNKYLLKCIAAIAAATKLNDDQFNVSDDPDGEFVGNIQYTYLSNESTTKYLAQKDKDLPMILFAHVITLSKEWHLNSDYMHLTLVVELYRRGDLDKLAEQISSRVENQAALSKLLLKIASQRILALVGLSPYLNAEWRKNTENLSLFQPNVCTWLKSIVSSKDMYHRCSQLFLFWTDKQQSTYSL